MSAKSWDQFYGFLQAGYSSLADQENELKEAGIDVKRVNRAVAAILARQALKGTAPQAVKTAAPGAWLDRARQAQASFETKLKAKKSWLSEKFAGQFKDAKELAQAIARGELGVGVQQHAQVFFRERSGNELSEEDLKSFIDDCELLDMIEGPGDQPAKNGRPNGGKSGPASRNRKK